MWELRHLKSFVTVARVGSFTKAARVLHISQPALTVQIRQLEQSVKGRLLDRNARSVTPTVLGRELAATLEPALVDLDAIVARTREWARGVRGTVSVAALPSVAANLLPRAISALKRAQPAVVVRLRDVPAQAAAELVRSGDVDFAVSMHAPDQPDLVFEPLFRDPMCAVFPTGDAFQGKKSVSLTALKGRELLLTDSRSSVRSVIDSAFAAIGHFTVPAYEAASVATLVAMARAGLGVAIVPTSMLRHESMAGISSCAVREPMLVRQIGIVQRKGRSLFPPAEHLVGLLRQAVKECEHS